jgi:hypothetical protein
VLSDYGLTEKVFAVTLDNASSNVSAMCLLRPLLSRYLESENAPSNISVVNSMFLH